jgi:hypothetical protein
MTGRENEAPDLNEAKLGCARTPTSLLVKPCSPVDSRRGKAASCTEGVVQCMFEKICEITLLGFERALQLAAF